MNKEYQLVRSPRRTLALEIARDATLIVRAPLKMPMESIHQFIEQRKGWIGRKQQAALERARLASMAATKTGEEIEWHKEQAGQKICARAGEIANLMGIKHGRVGITGARTRWGSFTRAGNINFSWRLILAPAWAIDYVIIHELAHILEHNHSRKFWQKVEQFYPEYKKCRTWLKENAHLLAVDPPDHFV